MLQCANVPVYHNDIHGPFLGSIPDGVMIPVMTYKEECDSGIVGGQRGDCGIVGGQQGMSGQCGMSQQLTGYLESHTMHMNV